MSPFLSWSISVTLVLYLMAMVLSLVRVLRGPRAQDRILAVDLIYILSVLVMLVQGIRHDSGMYFEGAMLMVLFGFVGSVAFAKFLLRGEVIE
jgi:multicomponent K+:H+ antiporter subunit F